MTTHGLQEKIAEKRAIFALSRFIQIDLDLYASRLRLLGDAPFHIPRGLPDLQQTLMPVVCNRVMTQRFLLRSRR